MSEDKTDTNRKRRDEVLTLVRQGKMSPSDADLWAAEHGEIFTQRRNPLDFNPMQQSDWTLPMVAAWIVERTAEAVREQWDGYRLQQRVWEFVWEREGDTTGHELIPMGCSNLRTAFGVFGETPEFPTLERHNSSQFDPAYELAFALRSGQLQAMGVRSTEQDRVKIPNEYWWNSTQNAHGRKVSDSIDSLERKYNIGYYTSGGIIVPRDVVLGIWPPLRKLGGDRSYYPCIKGCVHRVPTLPPGFHGPVWTMEQVMAWISTRNIVSLAALELADRSRPPWYGQRYRFGLVDKVSENFLREALVTEKVVGFQTSRQVTPSFWHANDITKSLSVWFRKGHILASWSELPTDGSVENLHSGNSVDIERVPRHFLPFISKRKKTGREPVKLNLCISQIKDWLRNEKYTSATLYNLKQKTT